MSIATSPQQNPVAGKNGTTGTAPAGTALRLVGAAIAEEHDLQGHALALESTCLRRRAERYAEAVERGAALSDEQVGAVLRAFRAYRPFLFDADRVQNDAARRRLAQAIEDSHLRRHDATASRDASVA